MPELTNVTFQQVIDERRMELVCEWGERYNDLVRTGLAKTELKGWSEDKALCRFLSTSILRFLIC